MKMIPLVALAACVVCAYAPAAQAEDRLQPDFTFRQVTVPTNGVVQPLIQIDPDAPSAIRRSDSFFQGGAIEDAVQTSAAPTTSASGGVTLPQPSGYEWFWASISPDLDASGPGRLAEAVQVLGDPPEGATLHEPRMDTLQDIAAAHSSDILLATIDTRVSPALVLALISVESGGRIEAVSGAGAAGLMQLMPATAERFGVVDRNDPTQNIAGGVAYLDWLLDHFDGDPILALAGYNAGEGAVRRNEGVPPYPETRGYVPKVLAAWTVARRLCRTPPVLISDGCVFSVNSL